MFKQVGPIADKRRPLPAKAARDLPSRGVSSDLSQSYSVSQLARVALLRLHPLTLLQQLIRAPLRLKPHLAGLALSVRVVGRQMLRLDLLICCRVCIQMRLIIRPDQNENNKVGELTACLTISKRRYGPHPTSYALLLQYSLLCASASM